MSGLLLLLLYLLLLSPLYVSSFVFLFVHLPYVPILSIILVLWLFCWHINNKELNWTELLLLLLWRNMLTQA